MKLFKWLAIIVLSFVVLLGVGGAALVYLVDWNNFRDTIQAQVKKQTGRDLTIAGDLKPTVFPWLGVSLGEIEFANATGFGDLPFAKMGSADVKVKLLPLLKKEVEVKTIELHGLNLDLQRSADGTTNWDDLLGEADETAAATDEADTTATEESGGVPIESLQIGGINITDANVSWKDVQSGTDVKLSQFNLSTGPVALAEAFDMKTDFQFSSNSMALASAVNGSATLTLDLDNKVYTINGLKLDANTKGESFPGGELATNLAANISARLNEQAVDISSLSLDTMGMVFSGDIGVTNLDTNPAISGQLSSNDFNPKDLFQRLGIEAPVTADSTVLNNASIKLALNATGDSARLDDLTIRLDDTTFSGNAQVPSLKGEVPPLRFDFSVDAIDLDRYLPPEAAAGTETTETTTTAASSTTGDELIELPLDMMRKLDIDGRFNVGSVKVKNLTTSDISVPLLAKDGVVSLKDMRAQLYQGQLASTISVNATSETPRFDVNMNLDGIQADPLLTDFMKKTSPLAGTGLVAANLSTSGNTVNGLKAALNGNFNTSFSDGFVRGINLGYQLRRARAAFTGQSLSAAEEQVKTDFTAMSVGGQIVNGVVNSDDLDMRSPLLRVAGAGNVDLPGEQVDYTLETLITGTSQGQGGEELAALKGVKLAIPIRGSFDELSADFAGVVFAAFKQNLTDNLANEAKAKAKAEAERLKAEGEAKLKAEEERARAKLAAEEDRARAKLAAEEQRARAELARQQENLQAEQAKLEAQAAQAVKKNKEKLEGKLKNLFK